MHYSRKIHEFFKTLAQEQPSAPAIITDKSILTYAELDAAADTLALELHTRGIGTREAIGVLVERSADLPATFLAILRAGGVYVPMVANLPADRLANFARQAGIRRLIVLDGIEPPAALIEVLTGNGSTDSSAAVIRPETLSADRHGRLPFPDQPEEISGLAAILFTSGSTGTPKGVMIQHEACVNLAQGHIAAHKIGPHDRILLSTSPGFILGFRELCIPLMSGASFVPVTRSTIDSPDRLLALMNRHRVSIAMFTPSYLRLLNGALPAGLRCIITAGELPNADDARHYARHIDYWNVHGATEVCGTICMHHVEPDGDGPIPSGRPFANTEVHLLDESGTDVSEGEAGEIYVVGAGVSRGYLNQPQLTTQCFVDTRYGRAFRTHDLARWNTNGELETVGRADDVVKISGQSVPLNEIERALMCHPDVKRAVAMQLKGTIVACVECPDPERTQKVDWREFLGRTLPSYMIPSQVATLDDLPISSPGKVDRMALLNIAASIFEEARELAGGTPPQGELEQAIAGIWEDVVGIRPIMRENNFFAVGGTSLLAIAVSQRLQLLGHSVPVQMVLTSLTVAALASQIAAMEARPTGMDTVAPAGDTATVDQEGFWIASEIGLAPAASHIVRVLSVRARTVQLDIWQSAWIRLIEHHAALRTSFYSDENGHLRWRTVESDELPPSARLSFDRCGSIEAARDIVVHRANEKFRLTSPPLVRAGLIAVDEGNETLFWFVLHHSVVDGTSARLIQDDLLTLLGGRLLPPAPNGIALAGRAERQYLVSDLAAFDREFWRIKLDALVERGGKAFDEYVTERPRPALPGGCGAPPLSVHLDAGTVSAMGRLTKTLGIGLHALLLTILSNEIRRRSGLEDVIVGSGISLRPAGGEAAIGHFVNVLPVIIMRDGELPFSSLLRIAQAALTETVEHAAYPAGLLYREFRKRHPELRAQSRTSLFDIALTAIPPRICVDRESDITLKPRPLPGELEHPAAGLDLSFSHEPCPEDGGMNLLLSWNPDVCTKNAAESWLSAFAAWVRWLCEDPGRMEQPLPALLPPEEALLERWERGRYLPLVNRRSHEVFEELVDRHPSRPAVVESGHIENFADLDARANGIAHCLIRQGVGQGTTVAVFTAGSADLPATLMGIWKAGGIYLPLPHDLPPARLAAMISDAGASFLVALEGLTVPKPLADSVKAVMRPEECESSYRRPQPEGSAGDVAYIIYTSGTTGMPKGVPVTHAGYVNILLGFAETAGLRPDDRMSLAATVGFDASLWELGNGLINGISLVPVSQALRDDPWLLKRYYRELGVTIAFHTPSYLRVSEQVPFEGLRILLTGGEAPNHRDVRCHADRLEFWNFYGPAEATIVASGGRISGDHDPETPLTVGRPLPNVRISLRRKDGSPVPPGIQGELWLGGIGIARDYLNRPDLSAERFVTVQDERFYRSGDYGRWTPDGRLEISGRIDDQIKLNGQRVEIGEIEQTLRKHPAILDAVVLVDELSTGVKTLRAFVRPRDTAPSGTALTEFLSEYLPSHMLPASITPIAEIPLNPSGKVDRETLLVCAKQQIETSVKEAPQSEMEIRIAAIWADLLGVPVARNDNFFALGGNSLLAVKLAHRVSENLRRRVSARLLFAAPTLAVFTGRIASQPAMEEPAGTAPETDIATEGEREFWTAEAAGLDTRTFTIPVHYLVIGNVAPDRWHSAWSTLIARHEGLRTFFKEDGTGLLQRRIAANMEIALEFAVAHDRTAALVHIRQRQADPLSMKNAPLWRAGLVEAKEDGEHFFWLALHHAIGDGQSVGTLLDELRTILENGALPPPAGSGRLFASREQSYLASEDSTHDAQYWINLLKEAPDTAFDEWPLDIARSSKTPPGNHRFEVVLNSRATEGLKALARNHESSLHSLMLALLVMETRRRTGRTDVLIGTTASVRELASDSRIVGYSVNMLPLHLRPADRQCFGEFLRATQRSLAEALQHARYPFARIYRTFWRERPDLRQPLRYPIFDIAVTENPGTGQNDAMQRFTRTAVDNGSVSYEYTNASPGQDMVLIHEVLGKGDLLLQLHVNAAIYSEETALSWFTALAGWARWLACEPARAEHPLPKLLPEEEAQLSGWECGDIIERPQLRFPELFEALVDRPGQAACPAVITREGNVSYGALEDEANVIAHALVRHGVGRGSIVGVLTRRSPRLPAAALGIWKAGAAYLPLASDLPAERLAFMARDAGVSRLIALDGLSVPESLADFIPDALRPEELSASFCREHKERICIAGKPSDVAYILYTSGSTGLPKGTLIGHDSYVNMVLGGAAIFGLTPNDRCLMFASPSFDVSLSDIGVPLACGAALCPAPYEVVESPNRFLDFLQDMGITVVDITPTYLRLFDGAALPASVRILVTGGEPPVPVDVNTYAAQLSYFNAYGPTETTITSTMGRLKGCERGPLTAGRPLPNTSVHICDQEGNPLPPGVSGEIWLGGAGLSQGYLNRPELTETSFVQSPRGRRYRSGDLGRWRRDGTLEIIGRIDDQVKLSGIRIELGEIEHALACHPAISQAVALLAGQDGEPKSLWAVVRLSPGELMPAMADWRAHLTERLPSHMIPSGVIPVPVIPLTAAGKVDRSALLALLADRPSPSGLTPPRDDFERCVADVWEAVLGHSPINREDNFFALGGHSLLAIAAAHRLEKLLGREVPARELFAEPTLAGFSERLRRARTPEEFSADASSDSALATVGQREFWTAEQAGLDTSGFNIPLTLAVKGDAPSAERWHAAWSELISRHDALRTGFDEDETGVLRRVVIDRLDAALEMQEAADTGKALALISARQAEPFSMSTPGLWRAGLTRVEEAGQTIFWFVMHHAVGDGLSLGILVGELTALLRGDALPPQAGSFNRTAAREEAYLDSKTAKADAAYWRRMIDGLIERSSDAFDEWPLDMPRPNARTAASRKGGHCFRSRLNSAAADGLRTLAKKNGATLHALMLTIIGMEAGRRTRRSGFLLGTAASIRQSAPEMQTLGYYINMLPLSFSAGEAESFDTLLQAMQQELAHALQHARYPFARIYGDFRREHPQATSPARYPLFDIGVTENPTVGGNPETDLRFTGVAAPEPGAVNYELRRNVPAQDMVLVHEGQPDDSIVLTFFVNAAIYTRDTAAAWFDSLAGWMRFLANSLSNENKPLPMLLPEEVRLLAGWQHGPGRLLPAASFPELFRTLAEEHPERPALITDAGVQSYAAVNARTEALAHALLAFAVKRGEPVAVFTQRSAALPETVLAIWKAGACYLPLAADLPPERLAFMARDAGSRILIVLDGLPLPLELVADKYTVVRPENLPADANRLPVTGTTPGPDDHAYIIYTSGSTGVPKGVVLSHGGMLNLGLGEAEILGIGPEDRALFMSSPSFDLWISDLVTAWSAGAAIVPVRREEMDDISGMQNTMQRLGVTVATMSPSYLHLFERSDFPGLRILMTVGEPPLPEDARHYAAKLSYFNGYGPTENTAASAIGCILPGAEHISAGRPLPNTAIYIVNDNGLPVPPGVAGEIRLGGMGLASGYLNRPDLTAASFVNTGSERRYSTGDLGRWLRSGELQILGRLDEQVKLRGQRVELGEIEHRLASYPGVQQAVAVVETPADGTQILRSFVTIAPQATAPTQEQWTAYLSSSLPSYMIPSTIQSIATIPLTAAGKVDRLALLAAADGEAVYATPALPDADGYTLRTPPQNAVEKRVAEVWASLLGCPRIAREDNFFELGGNSLKAIAAIGRLRREFECRVNDLYEHPVLADFAGICRPRPDHLRAIVGGICAAWEADRRVQAGADAERENALLTPRTVYEAKIHAVLERDLEDRQTYRHMLLSGATGYLGSYLLRELLACRRIRVTALVRGSDNRSARARLGQVLTYYFGAKKGKALSNSKRLHVLAGDLRQAELLLSPHDYGRLSETTDAIYHCAANVNHFGHYRDFYADNVTATRHLLSLAARRKPAPADFHFISTLSVAGLATTAGFRLFTEYDLAPEVPDDNYYIQTKQEAERLVIASRGKLANACIYRIGNISFATDSTRLQRNLADNAFFRQIVAFIRLAAVPVEMKASISHVDVVARALVALAGTRTLVNEIHHIETSRRDRLADFIRTADGMADRVHACDFGAFLHRLQEAIDKPELESALAETVETFGLQSSRSYLSGLHRPAIASDRTQALLKRLGVIWPAIPPAGQNAILSAALKVIKP